MAKSHGKDTFVQLDNVAGTLTDLSGQADAVSFPQTVDQSETSVFGTAAKAFIPGLRNGDTVSFSGKLDGATITAHFGSLLAAQAAGSSTATFVYAPAGSATGRPKVTAETWVASLEVGSNVADVNSWSASLQVTGAVTTDTY